MKADVSPAASLTAPEDDWRKFALMAAGMGLTLAAAHGFGLMLETPPAASLRFEWAGLAAGVAATAPLVLLLEWFMRTGYPPLARFRVSQIGFFAGIGFRFTPFRIAVLALGAGVTEELLFRGVLQTWAAGEMPLVLAVVLPNILFGALHWRTTLYAVIAGLVGVYFGTLFLVTGNLLAPIVAHALYDVVALQKTARAIAARDAKTL
ncbi:MAG: CPBP family intramembrane metalloprotease [Parvularculaceae bacterium]|jgi:hypothetical protein|nr:CPBP family intramembrane metalloprotease [Parvularculaceae bacterium]